jgi:hypothetical protein
MECTLDERIIIISDLITVSKCMSLFLGNTLLGWCLQASICSEAKGK